MGIEPVTVCDRTRVLSSEMPVPSTDELTVPLDRPAGPARFGLDLPWPLAGDQERASESLLAGLERDEKHQVLLGVTGSGKTVTMAKVIAESGRPALVLAHNKTLAAQLYGEFKEFFPKNSVEYFVSYYDYYQPEAYIARSDTYIEKDSSRNEEIDRMRHAATRSLFERRDVIIVASVSCIYGIGAPVDYGSVTVRLQKGQRERRDKVLRHLIDIQYARNDQAFARSTFRVRGDTLEIHPAYEDLAVRIEFFGDVVERITEIDPLTGELLADRDRVDIYPARHFVTPRDKLMEAIKDIEAELEERLAALDKQGRLLESQRLRQRTNFDIEMLRETGTCAGVENYSRHLARRPAGSRPWTLLDYFPPDFLMFVDESHIAIPQVGGMWGGDRARKEILVDYGFRLPSALDNRPLTFTEFEDRLDQAIYVSATPGPYETEKVGGTTKFVEQIIRPTGLLEPEISVRKTAGQIDDLLHEIGIRVSAGQRAIVTTLTKKMAEDLSDYLREMGIKVQWLHSEIETIERIEILRDLRLGVYDVVVGVNLLREGIDLPEVTLVAILDADKEGYLRSKGSLIQVIGRAARHVEGRVVMYADRVTDSMQAAIDETDRRRQIQLAWNKAHGIEPTSIVKAIRDIGMRLREVADEEGAYEGVGRPVAGGGLPKDELTRLVADLERQMKQAARDLEFEKAAALRDQVVELRGILVLQDGPDAVLSDGTARTTKRVIRPRGRYRR